MASRQSTAPASRSQTPQSLRTQQQEEEGEDDEEITERELEALHNSYLNLGQRSNGSSVATQRSVSHEHSEADLRGRLPGRPTINESTGLLSGSQRWPGSYRTIPATGPATGPATPRPSASRWHSYAGTTRASRNKSRRDSFTSRISKALGTDANQTEPSDPVSAKPNLFLDDRVWYDQFTSTDWVHDSIADAFRVKELRRRRDWRGRLHAVVDGAQGWLLVLIIGVATAAFAYFIDVMETSVFDYKEGFCKTRWWCSRRVCCNGATECEAWSLWSEVLGTQGLDRTWTDFGAYFVWVVALSIFACLVTLQTKTSISSAISLSTLDENLAADHHNTKADDEGRSGSMSPRRRFEAASLRPPMVYYPAAGSGVAEVKVILSGFVLHGYLGVRTLVCKAVALILSVASGLSVGKEGPYVHIATCIGNIACRIFPKYRSNDAKRREVLAASAAAGVAVAFGAPIGGVLFSLEEVSYYFPHKVLFRTFFCSIAAALTLKFFNPYGTGKIVMFEVRYLTDWRFFEIFAFIFLGILGGFIGALFIKASRFWARRFRGIRFIRRYPIIEVLAVAVVTGLLSFWNRYTRHPVAELLYELSAPCDAFSDTGYSLCPTKGRIPQIIWYLCIAFVLKTFLTMVTFGIKLPAGIYVPSMVIGGLMGRIVGHLIQLVMLTSPRFSAFVGCPTSADSNPESCVVPGVYALVAAGATMCGVTRLSVTLAVILFELTGSLEHVLPFSLGVLVAKWTADAMEPLSIYDLLTDMNAYPYLDSKVRPVFSTDLGDLTHPVVPQRSIDISLSPLVPAMQLRAKLDYLHMSGELDGGLPILRDGILMGLIPAPDLEYALDRLENENVAMCRMNAHDYQPYGHSQGPSFSSNNRGNFDSTDELLTDEAQPLRQATTDASEDPTDFTFYVDPAPVSLDICSSMDLVFECFVKLGLRYICVLEEGRFAGLVHKKTFVKYVKDVIQGRAK